MVGRCIPWWNSAFLGETCYFLRVCKLSRSAIWLQYSSLKLGSMSPDWDRGGSLNYPFGEIQSMQICGDFEGFPVHSASFGLETWWPLLRLWFSFPTVRIGSDEKLVQVYSRANRRRAGKTFPKVWKCRDWLGERCVQCGCCFFLHPPGRFCKNSTNKSLLVTIETRGSRWSQQVLKHVFFLHSFLWRGDFAHEKRGGIDWEVTCVWVWVIFFGCHLSN